MNGKLLLAACAVLGGVLWLVPWSPAAAGTTVVTGRDLFTVRRDDLRITITENGRLVAKESQRVRAKIKGEGKIAFLVEEGKEVKKDDVVCRLDPSAAQRQVEESKLEILQTEQGLKTARTELEIQTVENGANISKAQVALDRARQELEKYRDGEAPQERRKLEVAIKDAETDWSRARKNLDDSQKLLEQNYIKKSELEDHQIAFERAVVQRDGAELALRIFEKYTLPMTTTDLATRLADAEREVSTAQKRAESTLGQKTVAVQQVEKRLKMQQEQLVERQQELDGTTLTAPGPGLVLYGDPHEPWYRERVRVGSQIYNNFAVLSIPDLRIMQVKLQVHEADISKLATGQRAAVTTDSFPGRVFAGEVTRIATIASNASDWSGSSEVRKFDVEVTLAPVDDQVLRPGTSAKVEIHADTRKAVLFVPLQCVFAEDGRQYCHVLPGEPGADGAPPAPERRAVEIGAANETYVEIAAGLAAGERVLLYNPSLPDAGPPSAPRSATPERAASDGNRAAAEATAPRKSGS